MLGDVKHYYTVLRQTIFTARLNIKCPAALYYIKLYCIVIHFTVLYCIVLYCTVLNVLYFILLCCILLY